MVYFELKERKTVIKRFNSTADAAAFLGRKKAELLEKIAELTRQIAVLDSYMAEGQAVLEAPVLIKTLLAVTVAAMQARLESYDALLVRYADKEVNL